VCVRYVLIVAFFFQQVLARGFATQGIQVLFYVQWGGGRNALVIVLVAMPEAGRRAVGVWWAFFFSFSVFFFFPGD